VSARGGTRGAEAAAGALDVEAAARRVAEGGLVAFPTETVWGLGADATRPEAVAALRAWKGRDGDKPISVLVEGRAALDALGVEATALARALAEAFWPGPLTLVVPAAHARLAPGVVGADGTVGLRCSPDPTAAALARALARAGAGPLTATSLNRGGEAPARSLDEARALCRAHPGPAVVAPVAGARGGVSSAPPSTVVDCTGPVFRPIREGAISARELEAALARAPGTALARDRAPRDETEAERDETEAPRGAEAIR
jgi:L-threonylcarbamoyladenylate synthase